MKKLILLPLVLIYVLGACKKDDSPAEAAYTVSAKKNGVMWIGTNPLPLSTDNNPNDAILINAQNGGETLNFIFKSKGVGKYKQSDLTTYYGNSGTTLNKPFSSYRLSNDATNQLTITRYDEGKNIMTGNFDLTFEKYPADNNSTPNKIVFTYGAFKAPINHVGVYIVN
ncbi:DUF6252 family protein [Mucilaginibacter jinjuensis]|uniref:DUF6252 family protein n=1 Tax=Mucilaginibacter jinjuensis TaxID=1176721 RepID=A0ABY7T9B2_9SPHI|nr:DUF6252 family protein [Mucilaginibacter jinjuensis]WCT12888.1 DUF6252 family protein [Mucilaginibacter jinjuensis]